MPDVWVVIDALELTVEPLRELVLVEETTVPELPIVAEVVVVPETLVVVVGVPSPELFCTAVVLPPPTFPELVLAPMDPLATPVPPSTSPEE